MKSSFCIDLQRFMLIPTKFPLIRFLGDTMTKSGDMRRVFEEIEHINPEARYSIWHALEKEGKLISINDK